jgi:hypothetical protein
MSLSPDDRARIDALETRLEEVRRAPRSGGHGRYLVASAVAFAFLVAPLTVLGAKNDDGPKAVSAGNSRGEPVQIQIRNRSRGETGLVTVSDGYSMRLSNKSVGDGGGAIYGCRSAPGREMCVTGDNLNTGQAFFFRSRKGTQGGTITVANGGANTKPFTTNATGVATGLNADEVDGVSATQILSPPQSICPSGTLALSGGCIETSARGALPFQSAARTCATAGRRLPSVGELESLRQQPVALDNGGADFELTDSVFVEGGNTYVLGLDNASATTRVPYGTAKAFRCVV